MLLRNTHNVSGLFFSLIKIKMGVFVLAAISIMKS